MKNVVVIKDHKFKNTLVSVRFLSKLNKETVLSKMILANLLNDACMKYDTKQKVSNHLDELYGSSYSASSNILGNSQIMVAKVKSIDSKFINHKVDLLEEQFKLLNEFLLNPLMNNDSFLLERFEEAKKFQKDYMERINDDPNSFCMYEALRIAGESQPLGDGVSSKIEDLEDITIESINELYHSMLNDDQIDILVFGDVDEEKVQLLCDRYLGALIHGNNRSVKVDYCVEAKEMEPLQYGKRDISQSYITSVYATNTTNNEDDFRALRVANAILGQLPSSLLFQNIREKNSLCYSIYSALNPYDGVLAINTGVEDKNVKQTLTLIEEQYQKMLKGEFDDELFETSKHMIINSLRSTNDDIDSILALAYRNVLFNKNETAKDVIEGIRGVSKEDVVRVMNKTQYITSYILSGKE